MKNIAVLNPLRSRFDWIDLCACEVASERYETRCGRGMISIPEGERFCADLAINMRCFVRASECIQVYRLNDWGEIEDGDWEGIVKGWDKGGRLIWKAHRPEGR